MPFVNPDLSDSLILLRLIRRFCTLSAGKENSGIGAALTVLTLRQAGPVEYSGVHIWTLWMLWIEKQTRQKQQQFRPSIRGIDTHPLPGQNFH